MGRNKKLKYIEALDEAYEISAKSGLEEGIKYLSKFKWETGIKNLAKSILIKKYTRLPGLAVTLEQKILGLEYKEAKWAAVVGGDLAEREGNSLEALIILLGTRLNSMSFNATSKFLRVLRQGPIDTLTPEALCSLDLENLEPKQLISELYGNQYLECPYCGEKKPQSQFITGSRYCQKCRESFQGEVKHNRVEGKAISVAIIASEKTKKHIEKEN